MKKVDIHSLLHTQWEYKYHIVLTPTYRRKVFYGQKRYEIGQILRELCKWKGVNMLEGEACPDYIHILSSKMMEEWENEDMRTAVLYGGSQA